MAISVPSDKKKDMTVRILQLTDCHLLSDPEAKLKGVPTTSSLREVLAFIAENEEFDYLVISGDLAQDEQLKTYQILREMLGEWVPRLRLIPGNHDDRSFLRQTFPEITAGSDGVLTFSLQVNGWRVIGLDSHVPGQVWGSIDEKQLEWLRRELSLDSQCPTVLFLHHPPISVGSPWLDRIGLTESESLVGMISGSPQIRLVCSGHVHQEFAGKLGEAEVVTTPATSFQFRPREEVPIFDLISTGFRVVTLGTSGYQTRVVRLPSLNYPPDQRND